MDGLEEGGEDLIEFEAERKLVLWVYTGGVDVDYDLRYLLRASM